MTVPVVAFFNNIGGVGKTTLVYHVAWMLNELGRSVTVLDLDPQANLTASFVDERRVERLWSGAFAAYDLRRPRPSVRRRGRHRRSVRRGDRAGPALGSR